MLDGLFQTVSSHGRLGMEVQNTPHSFQERFSLPHAWESLFFRHCRFGFYRFEYQL